jgi:hypothetical protein
LINLESYFKNVLLIYIISLNMETLHKKNYKQTNRGCKIALYCEKFMFGPLKFLWKITRFSMSKSLDL